MKILKIALLLWPVLPVAAEDQLVVIEPAPKECAAAGVRDEATLSQSEAAEVVRGALGEVQASTYYMVHAARLEEGELGIAKQHWYTFYQRWRGSAPWFGLADPRWREHFQEHRIFGSKSVGLVYIHYQRAVRREALEMQIRPQIEAALLRRLESLSDTDLKAEVEKLPEANREKVNALSPADQKTFLRGLKSAEAQGIARRMVEDAGLEEPREGSYELAVNGRRFNFVPVYDANEREYLTAGFSNRITYKVAITKKLPAPLANLRDIVAMGLGGQDDKVVLNVTLNEDIALCGGRVFEVDHVPSDMLVSALGGEKNKEQKELAKNLWDNERKYRFDFSLALPLKSFKDLSVDSTNGNLTAKQVTKQALYAMFNFNPFHAYDTKKFQQQYLPIILVGIPISGQPLKHPILAGGVGINNIQFFVGTQFNLKRVLPAAGLPDKADEATAMAPGPIREKWGTQLIYGINFSVTAIKDLLKAKK